MRVFTLLFVVLLIAVAAGAEPIKIGVIAPLSGPLSEPGITFRAAIELAREKYDPAHRTEFIFEDDQYSARLGVTAAQKLIAVDKVACLLVWGTPSSIAISEPAERAKVPMIALSMVHAPFKGKKYVFRFLADIAEQVSLVANEVDRRSYKRIAILMTENEAMRTAGELLAEKFPSKVVFNESIQPGTSEVRGIVMKIAASKPDAVFLSLIAPTIGEVAMQLRRSGFQGDFFGIIPMQLKSEVMRAQGALEGAWFSTFDDHEADTLKEEILVKTNGTYIPDGAVGYDAAAIAIAALVQNDNPVAYLTNLTEFSGAFGVSKKNSGSNLFSMPLILKRVRGNDFEELPH